METLKWKKVTYPEIIKNMYIVSENGNVRNAITMKDLKASPDKDGYLKIRLQSEKKKSKSVFIHRLVAYAFCENPNSLLVVDHLDGNKQNNHFTNLEWVTPEENSHRAKQNKLYRCGEDVPWNKYSEKFIRHICELYENGLTPHQVFKMLTPKFSKASDYNALYQLLRHLAKKEHWVDICNEYEYSFENVNLLEMSNRLIETNPLDTVSTVSEDLIRFICAELEKGKKYKEIIYLLNEKKLINLNQDTKVYKKMYKLINRIAIGECWFSISAEYELKNAKTKRYYDARKLNKLYNECDIFIRNMVDSGASRKDIYRAYGLTVDDVLDERIRGKIDMMISNYKEMKKINSDTIIYINFK